MATLVSRNLARSVAVLHDLYDMYMLKVSHSYSFGQLVHVDVSYLQTAVELSGVEQRNPTRDYQVSVSAWFVVAVV